jgi:hypothetical protein
MFRYVRNNEVCRLCSVQCETDIGPVISRCTSVLPVCDKKNVEKSGIR